MVEGEGPDSVSPAERTVTHWPFLLEGLGQSFDTITLPTKWRAECTRQQHGPASDEGQAGLIEGTSRDCGVNEAHSGTFCKPDSPGLQGRVKVNGSALCSSNKEDPQPFCRQVGQVVGVLSLGFGLH